MRVKEVQLTEDSPEVIKARAIHEDKYKYLAKYRSGVGKSGLFAFLDYECPDHGKISQRQDSHLRGGGCGECSKLKVAESHMMRFEEFLVKVHPENAANFIYLGLGRVPVDGKQKIRTNLVCYKVCAKGHYSEVDANNDIVKPVGCGVCSNRRRTVENFEGSENLIVESTHIKNNKLHLNMFCSEHGEFSTSAYGFSRALVKCPKCSRISAGKGLRQSIADVVARVAEADVDLTLNESTYTGVADLAEFTCSQGHVTIKKVSEVVSLGKGCNMCSGTISKFNLEIAEIIKGFGFDVVLEKQMQGRKSVDVFVPSKNLAIDYHGNIWHSTKYSKCPARHYERLKIARSLGWNYIQIFSDEWETRKPQIIKRIQSLLMVSTERVFARQCQVREVVASEAISFLNSNHIQGAAPHASKYIGLEYNSNLVAVAAIGFCTSQRGVKSEVLELMRYATKVSVVGGFSKIISNIKTLNMSDILVTYSDSRMFSGETYELCGFSFVGESKPDYSYITASDDTRLHKSNFQKSRIAKRFSVSVEGKTETQLTESLGYYKLYDCGKKKWELKL